MRHIRPEPRFAATLAATSAHWGTVPTWTWERASTRPWLKSPIVAAYLRGDADQVEIGRRLFTGSPDFVVGTFMLVDYLADQLTRNGEMSAAQLLQTIALEASTVAANEGEEGDGR